MNVHVWGLLKSSRALTHYPRGNGIVKRFHGFLKHTIQTLTVQTDLTANEMVAVALVIYRSTPHTKETPFYLCLHGYAYGVTQNATHDEFSEANQFGN